MPESALLLGFIGAAFVVIAIPGPSVMFTIGRSLALGRVAGVVSVAGACAASFLLAVVVAAGIGALVLASPVAFLVIKYAGAAYLVYLGIRAILTRRKQVALELDGGRQSLWRVFRQSLVVGLTNPKTIAFFAAVLPQFVDRHASWPAWLQMLLYGLIWIVLGFLSDSVWALVAGSARRWFASTPRRLEMLTAIGGAFIIALGIVLALLPENLGG